MKIAYVIGTLATQGGTARMVTEKANLLATLYGYDITIITCRQHENETNTYSLADNIKQVYLGISIFAHYKYKYPKRLWVRWSLNRLLQQKLNETVNRINPDILIGIIQCYADNCCRVKCRAKKIIECHEARVYSLSGFGMERSILSRVFLSIQRNRVFRTLERHADVIATLTEKDKQLWKKAKRVEVIPNFSQMEITRYSDCTAKRIIAVGRLEWEKGFGRLLEIWKIVSSKHPDWYLDIFGGGSLLTALNTIIQNNRIGNITIHDFTPNISHEFSNSSICAVSSYFEGFSLVLLEAMKHGVPCVAFDCPFGPGSIIQDCRNGFLVNNYDNKLFAERICRLIEDFELRQQFGQNAIEHAKVFDVNVIMNQWKALFESVL